MKELEGIIKDVNIMEKNKQLPQAQITNFHLSVISVRNQEKLYAAMQKQNALLERHVAAMESIAESLEAMGPH